MNKENLKIPTHVAIILDGNGRWAKEKGKKRRRDYETISETNPVVHACSYYDIAGSPADAGSGKRNAGRDTEKY